MNQRIYYFGSGGNPSPYGWLYWLIGMALVIGLVLLLLPVFGAVILFLGAAAIGAALLRFFFRLFSGSGSAEENQSVFRETGRMPGTKGYGEKNVSRGAPQLEVQDAEIIAETPRRPRNADAKSE